ncbi:hypothetical protein BGZ61DRAFT_547473 [Ilyonectria robusta]|uniref:uncharacterized protein n=1 Tax=Ilyonectria robusta TaxID=1079257 RepID=UPI001E8DE8C3|nr:uncharacterized protein BGZ61DRAFT_547473 [Ilyonectria robusta]KAH8686967.1 hypothetical protein BGZ61DRAFT_547473 [Ilyonectria robusta]
MDGAGAGAGGEDDARWNPSQAFCTRSGGITVQGWTSAILSRLQLSHHSPCISNSTLLYLGWLTFKSQSAGWQNLGKLNGTLVGRSTEGPLERLPRSHPVCMAPQARNRGEWGRDRDALARLEAPLRLGPLIICRPSSMFPDCQQYRYNRGFVSVGE